MDKHATKTRQLEMIEQLLEAVRMPLSGASKQVFLWSRDKTPEERDETARTLSEAAKALLPALSFSTEVVKFKALFKREEPKLRNLRKMLQAYVGKTTWEELEPVIRGQGTKSKMPSEKFRDYKDLVLAIMSGLDTEVETTLRIDRYNVALIKTDRGTWTNELIEILRWVLPKVTQTISKIGLGEVAYGTVIAYPTKTLPAAASFGHSTLASYSPAGDDIRIAISDNIQEVVKSMVHELGHRAYFRYVESGGRNAWSEFFESNQGAPDIDKILSDWEAFAANPPEKLYPKDGGAWLSHYIRYVDDQTKMWLEIIASKFGIREAFQPMTGVPKRTKGNLPALDLIKAKRNEIKVFLYPVTAYSGTNDEELFAEVISVLAIDGPGKVPEIVLDALKRTIPRVKIAQYNYDRRWTDPLVG